MLFFNDTVLRPGRWPYIVDWDAYANAVADSARADGPALLHRRDEGVWAVAAANPNVRLDPRADPRFPRCPAYDRERGCVLRKHDRTHAAAFMRRRAGPTVSGLTTLRLPAVREDRGRFAALRGKRVLIYWPHGFGDWVTFGAIAPLLEPSNTYAITRFGDDYVSLMEGNRNGRAALQRRARSGRRRVARSAPARA